jgi:hypothetical protein
MATATGARGAAATEAGAPVAPRRSGPDAWVLTGWCLLLLLPFGVAAYRLFAGGDFAPSGDGAIAELAIHDVGRHPVLLGAYSRWRFHHPGPAVFYALAPVYRALGSASTAPLFGAILINAASVCGILLLARRHAARVVPWCALVLALWIRFLGPRVVTENWNPFIAVLPFCVFVLVAWQLAGGWAPGFPLAVASGSFALQAHVGYAPAVGAVWVLTVGFVLASLRTDRATWARGRWWLVAGAVVAAVMWAPALWQQVFDEPGNVDALADFLGADRPTLGISSGTSIALRQLGAVPRALLPLGGVHLGYSDGVAAGIVTAIVFGLATVRAVSVRAGAAVRLAAFVVVVFGVSIVAAARIVGGFEPYLVTWMSATGFLAWFSVVASCAAPGGEHVRPTVARHVRLLVGTATAVVTVLTVVSTTRLSEPRDPAAAVQRQLTERTVAAVEEVPGEGPVLVLNGPGLWPQAAGVILGLEKAGIPPRVPDDWAWLYGPRLAVGEDRTRATVYVGGAQDGPAPSDARAVVDAGGVVVSTGP